MTDLAKLKEPFAPDRISWRVGSTTQDKKKGLAFGYIDARDVMERLDAVCGVDGWQNKYSHANGKTVCDIGVRCGDEWIWKADGSGDTDVEAEKGALSDAFKRAAVRFGIGRYLYDIPATWVEVEPAGKSYRIKDSELPKLARIAGGKVAAPIKELAPLLSEPVATEVATRLRDEINGCVTWDELDKFIKSDGFKHRVGSLPEKHRGGTRQHYTARAAALKERSAA